MTDRCGSGRQLDDPKNEVAVETIESPAVFSGDAYDNETGLRAHVR